MTRHIPLSQPRAWIGRLIVALFVLSCGLLSAAVVAPYLYHAQVIHSGRGGLRDLEQVRGMGNGFTLYWKKYGAFPNLGPPPPGLQPLPTTRPSTTGLSVPPPLTAEQAAATLADATAEFQIQRKNGGHPACLALKLLMSTGMVEDAKCFFSPRDAYPTEDTLAAMTKNLDPRVDPTWACTYAYDPGHDPYHGSVPFFGNRIEFLRDVGYQVAHVLTCEQVAKEVEPTADNTYVIQNHRPGDSAPVTDDIYTDDSATLGFRDAFLQWDVPKELP